MERILSAWKITFDPSGIPVVLLDYGDIMEAEPAPARRDPCEVVDLAGSDWPFLRPLGNRRFELAFGVYQTYATDVLARRAVMDSLLVAFGKKPLRVEIDGLSGTYWQFANACVTAHDPVMSVEKGNARNLKKYTITATVFTRSGP